MACLEKYELFSNLFHNHFLIYLFIYSINEVTERGRASKLLIYMCFLDATVQGYWKYVLLQKNNTSNCERSI